MSRTMALMGWVFWTFAGLMCAYLAYVDPAVAEEQVGQAITWMAANRPDPELLKKSPFLAGLFTGQVMLTFAAAFLLGANGVFLVRQYSKRFGRGRPRKDILFEDHIGTTTVEISALEIYLRDALQAEEDIEKVDLTINMPMQDDHPIVIDVKLRMRARENIPGAIEKKVKEKTRQSFLQVIPMDIPPVVRASVQLASRTGPRNTVTDGVLRASTRMRVTTPGADESRRAAAVPLDDTQPTLAAVPAPSLFSDRKKIEAPPEEPQPEPEEPEQADPSPPPMLLMGQASYATDEDDHIAEDEEDVEESDEEESKEEENEKEE